MDIGHGHPLAEGDLVAAKIQQLIPINQSNFGQPPRGELHFSKQLNINRIQAILTITPNCANSL